MPDGGRHTRIRHPGGSWSRVPLPYAEDTTWTAADPAADGTEPRDEDSSVTVLAIGLALAGAVAMAFGVEFQHTAVRARWGAEPLQLRSVRRLLRSGRWVGGILMSGGGTAMQAVALALAPVTVVQPIGVIALVITASVNARTHHLRFPRSAVLAIAACTAGVGVFVAVASRVTTDRPVTALQERTVLVVLFAALVVLAGYAVVGRHRRSRRGMLNIVFGATLYGCVAVMTRLFSQHVLYGRWDVYAWLLVPAIVAGVLLGGWFVQSAYTKAPPDLVVAGLTVLDPLVAVTLGLTVLWEGSDMTPGALVVLLGCGAVAVAGVVVLSRFHPQAAGRRTGDAAQSRA